MRRGWKILFGVLAGVAVLLVLNAIAVSNQTRDAEVNAEGAELIETSNGALQVADEGDPGGSAVVLIHGYAGSLRWFDELASLLGQDHRVIRVDLLGHGGSDKPGAGYAITDQANALAEALSALEVQDATVVGHSLGATVAVALAEQSPELATRVVNLGQAPDESYEDLSFAAELRDEPLIGQTMYRLIRLAPTSTVRGQLQDVFAPEFNIASGFENPDQVVDDLEEMTYTAFVEVSDAESDYTAERPLSERLASLGVPALVVFGSEDQVYDPEAAIGPYQGIPAVRAETIEGAGHSPHVEAPEGVAALIGEFVAQAEAAQRAERRARRAQATAQREKRRAQRAKRMRQAAGKQ